MADNSDIINSALRRAMRYEGGYGDYDLTPAYSTADIVRGVDPLAGVGSRLGTKWTSYAQDEAARQRFLDAEHKPTLIGKTLGSVGIDESGERAATPWLDAFLSTLHMPSRFIQAGKQALTAAPRALNSEVSYYDTIHPQRDEKGNEYISDMGPITPGTAVPEGLNFAGMVASSSPVATATGAVPANTAGMFAGRLAKTADHAALAQAEKMAAEGAPREQIWKNTGWFQGKDGKWRFEIDDRPSYIDMKHDGDFYRSFGYGLSGDSPLVHPELAKAYDLNNLAVKVDPEASYVAGSYAEGAPATPDYKARDPQITVKAPSVGELKSPALHEAQHHVQRLEGFQRGDAIRNHDPIAIRDEAIRPFDRQIQELMDADPAAAATYRARNRKQAELRGKQWTDDDMAVMDRLDAELNATEAGKRLNDLDFERESVFARPAEFWKDEAFNRYMRSAGETEARAVEARRLYTPENRRAVPPWEDYDVPESQQIVRGVSSNPDGASIPGVVVRDAAEKPTRAYHGTPEAWEGRARGPFWMSENPDVANQFAMNPYITDTFNPPSPAVMPLNVDTSNYLRIKPNSLLDKFDRRFGEMNVMPIEDEVGNIIGKEGRNWTFDIAKLLGYDGVKWDSVRRDFNEPVMAAIRPTGTVRSATSGDVIYSNPTDIKASAPGVVLRNSEDPVTRALRVARSLDPLGYYSKLDEVLGGFKPTDKVTSQTLQQRGVKASEIEARGLKNLLADGSAVPVSELQGMAKGNGVGLNESKYGTTENWVVDPWQWGHGRGEPKSFALRADAESYAQSIGLTPEHATPVTSKATKWQDYSLDKGNPTYRESVLHLPANEADMRSKYKAELESIYGPRLGPSEFSEAKFQEWMKSPYGLGQLQPNFFSSGHWSEPNVIAHARTSIQKDTSGKNVFLVDELQSDWGQKIRDKGARDEGKISYLRKAKEEAGALSTELLDKASIAHGYDKLDPDTRHTKRAELHQDMVRTPSVFGNLGADYAKAHSEYSRLSSELTNAEMNTVPSHPLVSTTDQWTTTALRRLIKQAVDSGADAISFTPGKVQAERYNLSKHVNALEYNPAKERLYYVTKNGKDGAEMIKSPKDLDGIVGKELAQKLRDAPRDNTGSHRLSGLDLEIGGEGMKSTYDSMYPRTLGKILSKMDPSVKMETRNLTSHNGKKFENDFITFPITDKIRKAVGEGQPLFSNAKGVKGSVLPGTMTRNAAPKDTDDTIKRALSVSGKYTD